MSDKSTENGIKVICENRKARHNYFIDEQYEAGMVLAGTEVKALRDSKANLTDAYALFRGRELFLVNAHIGPYAMGNRENHEPLRSRKLLLGRSELNKLWEQVEIKKASLIPLKMYFKKGRAKVEIGVGRGKKNYDKRQTTKDREAQRDMAKISKMIRR